MKKLFVSYVAVLTILAAVGAEAKEYLVGVHMPLTGPYARIGKEEVDGINVAMTVFNKKNPKHTIKLITIDDESSPAKAVSAVEKLAGSGVVGITGGFGTNLVGPASVAASKAGLVYVTSGSTSAEIVERGLTNFFRISNLDGYIKPYVSMFSGLGIKSVSIVYSTVGANAEFAKLAQKSLAAKGLTITMHPFDPGTTDFKPIVNKVKLMDKPDIILAIGYENDYVGILRATKVLKPELKAIVTAWGFASVTIANEFKDLVQNVITPTTLPLPVEFKKTRDKEVAKAFKSQLNKDVDVFNLVGYEQAMLLFEAIKRSADKGTLSKGGLVEEVRKTDVEVTVGPIAFNQKGDNHKNHMLMGQFKDGKINLVWPKEKATGKLNYPALPW